MYGANTKCKKVNVQVLALETSMKWETIFCPIVLFNYKYICKFLACINLFAWPGMKVKLMTYSLSVSLTIDLKWTWISG